MSVTEIGALARRLVDVGAGMEWRWDWYEDDVRALVEKLGWAWLDEADGPRALTGLRTGDARVIPNPENKEGTNGQEFVEIAVPVAHAAPDPLAQATAFRRAADAVTEALGAATIVGSYGGLRPFSNVVEPSWGTPYLRWRGSPATVELRAGATGPELLLRSTGPVEAWFEWLTYGRDRGFPGFFGTRDDPANAGMELPEAWVVWSWESLSEALAGFFGTLPAETTALGLRLAMPLYGRIPRRGEPLLFDVQCDRRLYIGCYAPDGMDAAALGWQSAAQLPHTHGFMPDHETPPWRIDAGGPGEVDGPAIAELLVKTARAAGLGDSSYLILGGEGEWANPYKIKFYGLGMRTG